MKRFVLIPCAFLFLSGFMVQEAAAAGSGQALADQILIRLQAQPLLQHSRLRWETGNGAVTIYGITATDAERSLAEEVIRKTPGVASVSNQIAVSPRARFNPRGLSDSQVNEAVITALERSGGHNLAGLRVTTEGGVVSFSGSRPSFRDIDRILAIFLTVDGVADVNSNMTINGQPYSTLRFKDTSGHVTMTDG